LHLEKNQPKFQVFKLVLKSKNVIGMFILFDVEEKKKIKKNEGNCHAIVEVKILGEMCVGGVSKEAPNSINS
jgi:hypothetical protein